MRCAHCGLSFWRISHRVRLLLSPTSIPQQRSADLLPRRARLTPARGFLALNKKLGPAPPSIAFRPFGCEPVARCSPIAIKAAMVAT